MADSAVHYGGPSPAGGGGKSLPYPCANSGIGHACIKLRREARQDMGKALAAASPAVSPRDVVQSAVARVVIALQKTDSEGGASPTKRLTAEQRRTEIRRVATDLFDFDEISRRALSRYWATRSAAGQAEFPRLFTDLLERAYIGRIEAYSGEKILYGNEVVDGSFATVRPKVLTRRNTETPLESRLDLKDG